MHFYPLARLYLLAQLKFLVHQLTQCPHMGQWSNCISLPSAFAQFPYAVSIVSKASKASRHPNCQQFDVVWPPLWAEAFSKISRFSSFMSKTGYQS